jgi:heme exporter protein CcmD
MSALAEYLAMGGYAGFVWPAYGFALAALGGLALHSWRRYRAGVTALGRAAGNNGPAR